MRRLVVFNSVTLNGYFTGKNGDLSWAHKDGDPEWNDFVSGNASGSGPLLFGRVTYEMMVSFWPTPAGMESFPEVAKGMNSAPKIVFSRTLDKVSWNNTKLVKGDLVTEVRKLKKESGEPITILGSGSIVSQLTQAGLIDEYQFVVNPIVLDEGRSMFDGVKKSVTLKQTATRTFGNGNVLLSYEATTGA
jgi:dihydrofolate reductase